MNDATTDATQAASCPRCGGAFHCGANDASPCACTTLRLDAALLRELQRHYRGCLCLRCLADLAAAAAAAATTGGPAAP